MQLEMQAALWWVDGQMDQPYEFARYYFMNSEFMIHSRDLVIFRIYFIEWYKMHQTERK
jgi:hypothetical protein